MLVHSILFKIALDKQNEQVLPEFKVKVNNGSCLLRVCSGLTPLGWAFSGLLKDGGGGGGPPPKMPPLPKICLIYP